VGEVAEFRVQVTAGVEGLYEDHPLRLAADDELRAMLREQPSVLVKAAPAKVPDNAKGFLQDLVVNLGGGGAAATFALRAFRLWLERDKRRTLTMTHTDADGRVSTRRIEGTAVSDAALREAIAAIGGPASAAGVAPDPVEGPVAGGDDALGDAADGD
jgi:hypothetical protein